jgi:TolA-binding protein
VPSPVVAAPAVPSPTVGPAVSAVATAAASAPVIAVATPATSAPAHDTTPSETDVYARAHRLHFAGGDPAGALAAWNAYLSQYPTGRFAPEARYNAAIDLLKMKRYADARAALQPFANGAYGGYHRDDARELLRSMP